MEAANLRPRCGWAPRSGRIRSVPPLAGARGPVWRKRGDRLEIGSVEWLGNTQPVIRPSVTIADEPARWPLSHDKRRVCVPLDRIVHDLGTQGAAERIDLVHQRPVPCESARLRAGPLPLPAQQAPGIVIGEAVAPVPRREKGGVSIDFAAVQIVIVDLAAASICPSDR